MMKYSILDIGCGARPHGNINLDLGLGKNKHHRYDYDVTKIQNFTRGVLSELPYRDNVFDGVFCSHVLEHVKEPLKALQEIKRVSRGVIILIVPNNPVFEEFNQHLYAWSKDSFRAFCKLEFNSVAVSTQCRYFQIEDDRIFRRLNKISMLRRPLARWVSRVMAVEIVAVCRE